MKEMTSYGGIILISRIAAAVDGTMLKGRFLMSEELASIRYNF